MVIPALLFLSVFALADEPAKPMFWAELFEERLNEYFPKDIASYIDRYRLCQHWQGEPGDDPERQKEIAAGIDKSCMGLSSLEKDIEKKISSGPQAQGDEENDRRDRPH